MDRERRTVLGSNNLQNSSYVKTNKCQVKVRYLEAKECNCTAGLHISKWPYMNKAFGYTIWLVCYG